MTCPPAAPLIRIISHGDVAALQRRLGPAVVSTDGSMRACAELDTATRAAWGLFYIRAQDFVRKPLSWYESSVAPMHEGESLECDLISWQEKLKATGCALSGPDYTPTRPPAADITTPIKYASIAVASVALAWGISKLVPFIPLPRHEKAA